MIVYPDVYEADIFQDQDMFQYFTSSFLNPLVCTGTKFELHYDNTTYPEFSMTIVPGDKVRLDTYLINTFNFIINF
jgi:hypothetical protein